jgi:hypothetical protein
VDPRSNCRIILDPDWNKELKDPHHRCILVTTKKVERSFEYRLDVEYARMVQAESSSEEESCCSSPEVTQLAPSVRALTAQLNARAPSVEDTIAERALIIQEASYAHVSSLITGQKQLCDILVEMRGLMEQQTAYTRILAIAEFHRSHTLYDDSDIPENMRSQKADESDRYSPTM